jgi:hypothetical protein
MTWGIQDFVDDKGESNGKYTSLSSFPTRTTEPPTQRCLTSKAFEDQLLADAVKNSEAWWGEQMDKSM